MISSLVALTTLAAAAPSPWNGDWVLDAARSSPAARDGAADGYRFHVAAGRIRWEIPSLKEVVDIPLGGQPAPIRRPGGDPSMAIAAQAEGPTVIHYRVLKSGVAVGEGRMTLVDEGKAWVDLVWPAGKPLLASEIVYAKR